MLDDDVVYDGHRLAVITKSWLIQEVRIRATHKKDSGKEADMIVARHPVSPR